MIVIELAEEFCLPIKIGRGHHAALVIIPISTIKYTVRAEMNDASAASCSPPGQLMRKKPIDLKDRGKVVRFGLAFCNSDAVDDNLGAQLLQRVLDLWDVGRIERVTDALIKQ